MVSASEETPKLVETRRGSIRVRAQVVRKIRPDTVFVPYHWPGEQSANVLTHRTLDPRRKFDSVR